jgi:hypothetical protein
VVAERDRVGPEREELLRELRRQPDPVGGVLAVDDADVDSELLAQRLQPQLERAPTRNPDDVGDEEEDQGRVRTAAE